MMRFTNVVLPAPVGPTMATVVPGSATNDKSVINGRSGLYEKLTFSNATRPCTGAEATNSASALSSSASSTSNTRSADATPDCSTFIIDAVCVSGCVNWREY